VPGGVRMPAEVSYLEEYGEAMTYGVVSSDRSSMAMS
jgi:hypothetical protein